MSDKRGPSQSKRAVAKLVRVVSNRDMPGLTKLRAADYDEAGLENLIDECHERFVSLVVRNDDENASKYATIEERARKTLCQVRDAKKRWPEPEPEPSEDEVIERATKLLKSRGYGVTEPKK